MVALFASQSNVIDFPSQTKSNEWYTPARYIEAAREVMGGIDLDPASCKEANMVVRAEKFYTKHENGLEQPWYGKLWLNPPYGLDYSQSDERRSTIANWINKVVQEYQCSNVEQALLLTTAQIDAKWFRQLWEYPICFTDHHLRFYLPHGRVNNPGAKTKGHIHGAVFTYLGKDEQKFIDTFSQFGTVARRVSIPKHSPVNLELWKDQ